MNWSILFVSVLGAIAIAIAIVVALAKIRSWLLLFRATPRSLRSRPRVARLLASQIPFYEYGPERIFCSDDAPAEVAERRRAGFMRLAETYRRKFAKTNQVTDEIRADVSDLQFTDFKRVPFQFSGFVLRHLRFGEFLESSSGVTVTDLDGNIFYDLAASYGVNVFGYDFYKETIERGVQRARALGPVLGEYHMAVRYNVRRLKESSGLDEISFHMSGTEAIMQAVRLARYHTGRSHLVMFSGAYHGWWGDVQPGVGNPVPAHETYTLTEMSDDSLRVLQTRRDIACVLINPAQVLQPNANIAPDSAQDSAPVPKAETGRAHIDRGAYANWLRRLRSVCTERKIALIFDEVFVGFHLALGGAQEYFGVRADFVTYGKTIAGGLPIGVVCGRHDFMKRYRDDRPLDVCFARGTFNSHPYVMATMREFLERVEAPDVRELYKDMETVWDRRTDQFNQRMRDEGVPVRVTNMTSIWNVYYTHPCRYNWMLQYYLRAEGLALSWIGTGRIIFSLNYTQADFDAVVDRFAAAANTMRQDGWWWADKSATSKSENRRIVREILVQRLLRARSNTPRIPRVGIYHNMLWARYKGAIFSKIHSNSSRSGVAASFVQVTETETQRSMLGKVDLTYHQYPYRLLFPGRYGDVPLYRLVIALMADVFRNPSELVVLPGYDRIEFWAMLMMCILLRRKRAVWCDSTSYDQAKRYLWREIAKAFFFAVATVFFATESGVRNM